MTTRKITIRDIRPCADGVHAVVTIVEKNKAGGWNRREPCAQCPWRADLPVGVFPPDAFVKSAPTAYDVATTVFACHMSGSDKPATCAGFLLRNAANNLAVRLAALQNRLVLPIRDGGHELYDDYRSMAIANGVDPDDPALVRCRANDDGSKPKRRRG
jgi:hypothetical protein